MVGLRFCDVRVLNHTTEDSVCALLNELPYHSYVSACYDMRCAHHNLGIIFLLALLTLRYYY